ncbi:hypothetical protein B0I37DRAFT_375664 [Chaetomium sp. MPI-CAGE-AT-0009]|nr:hypothetical protein B0I37DRAFT_375664 [Chaetomium sp. MPI-CAGE-AT-0009]
MGRRLDAIEAIAEGQQEVIDAIRRHGRRHDGARGDMGAVFDRIQQVSALREDAEQARFERAEAEREAKVEELDDKHDELEEEFEKFKDQRNDDSHRFRQMRNLLVALSDGDITLKELGVRVRALDMED